MYRLKIAIQGRGQGKYGGGLDSKVFIECGRILCIFGRIIMRFRLFHHKQIHLGVHNIKEQGFSVAAQKTRSRC